MSQEAMRWLVGIAAFLVIEGLFIWKIMKTFRIGSISFNPVFWLTNRSDLFAASRALDFRITAQRATHPVFFWILTLILIGFALAFAAFFAVLAFGTK
jgi:hypothetical protein